MSLQLLSWNMNGFHSSGSRVPRKLISSTRITANLSGHIDVLILQAPLNRQSKSLVGAVGFAPQWGLHSNVVHHSSLVPSRALWVSLDIEGSTLGILNVYAPTDLHARASFWLDVVDSLPEMDSWIIGGDFNNLETLEDQQGRGSDF